MRNQYRLDIVNRKLGVTNFTCVDHYRVPCGMTSIAYIGARRPSSKLCVQLADSLKGDKVVIASEWNNNKQDYVIFDVLIKH